MLIYIMSKQKIKDFIDDPIDNWYSQYEPALRKKTKINTKKVYNQKTVRIKISRIKGHHLSL